MLDRLRTRNGQLWLPFRLVWNPEERRLRSPIRILGGVVLVLMLANIGRQYQPVFLTGPGPLAEVGNTLSSGLPQVAGIVLGVSVAAVVLDRRVLTDLGLRRTGSGRRFGGGLLLGAGITTLSIGVGVVAGYYEVTGIEFTGDPAVWMVLVVGTALSQLGIVVGEELLARGYLITNIVEGCDGLPGISREVAAGIGILVAALFFYITHSARGAMFGIMAGGLAILLGIAYVVTGDLWTPVGIHFGVNFAGMLGGTAPQPATLLELTTTSSVADSVLLPRTAVGVRLGGAALAAGFLLWWYRTTDTKTLVLPSVARPTLRWTPTEDTLPDKTTPEEQ